MHISNSKSNTYYRTEIVWFYFYCPKMVVIFAYTYHTLNFQVSWTAIQVTGRYYLDLTTTPIYRRSLNVLCWWHKKKSLKKYEAQIELQLGCSPTTYPDAMLSICTLLKCNPWKLACTWSFLISNLISVCFHYSRKWPASFVQDLTFD